MIHPSSSAYASINPISISSDSTDKLSNSRDSRSSSPGASSSSSSTEQLEQDQDLTSSLHQTITTQSTSNHSSQLDLIANGTNSDDDSDPSGPFEGPEKLLEIWFAQDEQSLPETCLKDHFSILNKDKDARGRERKGLRAVPRAEWEKALDLVKCKVLSTLEGEEVDAYLLRSTALFKPYSNSLKAAFSPRAPGESHPSTLFSPSSPFSESSMFIFPHKLILKTCGTTTLLLGLERLLRLSRWGVFGFKDALLSSAPSSTKKSSTSSSIQDESLLSTLTSKSLNTSRIPMGEDFKSLGSIAQRIFYSRKSFMFPERQKGPHKDWMLEVGVLDGFFKNGSAYTVGKMNGDHWLLYMSCPMDCEEKKRELKVERPFKLPSLDKGKSSGFLNQDSTLEILMTHLSKGSCERFTFPPPEEVMREVLKVDEHGIKELKSEEVVDGVRDGDGELSRGHKLGLKLSEEIGLESLFENTLIDAFAFDPCGYSANAIVAKSDQTFIENQGFENSMGYWTVHVTPEEDSSYASFETNISLRNLSSSSSFEGKGNQPKDLPSLISKVIEIFNPGKMSITLFLSTTQDVEESEEEETQADLDGERLHQLQLKGYNKTVRIAYEFEGYDLVFVSFEKV